MRWAFLFFGILVAAPAAAQDLDRVRVFLDCSHRCDDDYLRTEINYINWVRDRADAHVHVLVADQNTGGGGRRYSFTFTGLRSFAGREDTLSYTAANNESSDITRRAMARVLKAGLVPYIVSTAEGARRLDISWAAADAGAKTVETTTPTRDPWDFWVFSLSARTNFDGEESQKFQRLHGNVSANRTTERLKLRIGFNGTYNESEFTYPASETRDTTITSIRKGYNLNLLGVRSFGDHWSAGIQAGANSATFGNVSLGLSGGPAIEYSFWPYSESTRRSLVVRYSGGIRSFDYREITIYQKMQETHPAHSLTSELNLRQRWGSLNLEAAFSQYLHDTQFYNASTFANANLKLFKGFSLDFYGSYTKVRDQLSLSAGDLTPEEVLLQQRQLRTGYRYWGGIGVRYSFGSIFNNVVNPRFGEGGGFVIFE